MALDEEEVDRRLAKLRVSAEAATSNLIELEDQSWFPATIRDLATDYLHFAQTATSLDKAMTPLVREALGAADTIRIVDLCSGGSGPLPALLEDLGSSGMRVTATATVQKVDGRTVYFTVEARDERELIGDGTHERVVVNVEKFDQRVKRKLGQ